MIEAFEYYKGRKKQVIIEVPNFDKGFVVRSPFGGPMLYFGQKPYFEDAITDGCARGWWPNNDIYPMQLPTDTFPEVSWENKKCLEVKLGDDRLAIKEK